MFKAFENMNEDELHFVALGRAAQILISELFYPGSIRQANINDTICSRYLISSSAIPCPYMYGGDPLSAVRKDTEIHMDSIPCIAIDLADVEAIRLEAPEIADDLASSSINSFNSLLTQFYHSKHILERGCKKKYKIETYQKDKAFISLFVSEILKENLLLLNELTNAIVINKALTRAQIQGITCRLGFCYKSAEVFANMMEHYSNNPSNFHKIRDEILLAQAIGD